MSLPRDREGHISHTFGPVYGEMLLTICADFSMGDPRTLKAHQIRFFYNGERDALKKRTSPVPTRKR